MRLFVNPPKAPEILDGQYIEKFAKKAHAKYRAKRGSDLTPAEPGLCAWDKLLPHLQESNRQQVAHIEDLLSRVGIGLRPVEGRQGETFQPDPETMDTLAQLEHARWNMERLLDGWKPGPRDPIAKTSPFLVPWSELDEETRGYDYDAVRKNLEQLRQHGYEAYTKGKKS